MNRINLLSMHKLRFFPVPTVLDQSWKSCPGLTIEKKMPV